MSKRNIVIPFLVLLVAIGTSTLWTISHSTAESSPLQAAPQVGPDGASVANPLISINRKALAAKDGDEAATNELVDEMFRMFGFDQLPAGIDEPIKERLVRAEFHYRNGHGKSSSSEFRVVHMVNQLADGIGAPAYAKTNVFEVKRLRGNLLLHVPDLQTRRHKNNERKDQKHNDMMSPLEAFFVAGMLIKQKQHNPEYQLTNDEWIALHGGKRTVDASNGFKEEMKRRRLDPHRTREVRRAMVNGFAALRASQMLRLPEQLLNTLGIEK